jgi:hypothetical protein
VLRIHDPEHAALRKAARTAIVLPSVFAVCLYVFDDLQMAILGSFGSIGLLGFADFGGPPLRRGLAYVGLTVTGIPLIALATAVSSNAWLAALVMAAVAFVITFTGLFGGYVAAGERTAMLTFLVCVAIPAPAEEIPARIAGWSLAGAASTAAALLLWPRFEHARLLRLASTACVRLAELTRSVAEGGRPDPQPMRDAVTDTSRRATTGPYRPSGPARHDQALLFVVAELRRAKEFAEQLVLTTPEGDADRRLLVDTAEVFEAAAGGLAGARGTIDLDRLERSREASMLALEQRTSGSPPAALDRELARAFPSRILSYLALSIAVNAQLVNGVEVDTARFEITPLAPSPGIASTARRLQAALRGELRGDSVWFQAAVRSAVALGIAVLVALLAHVDHAFWVLLGTMSALKSSAVTTSYTAWQALLGTVIGFGLTTAYVAAGGQATAALWVALPITVFLAVYSPNAVNAIVGAAMFTMTVVVLFTIIEPDGWRTGLIRVEDILIGSVTAAVAGLMLWPRGAGGQLRARLAAAFEACADHVVEAARFALGRASESACTTTADDARDTVHRARAAFATFLNERGPKRVDPRYYAQLLTVGEQLRFIGDALVVRARSLGAPASGEAAGASLDETVTAIGGEIEQAARMLLDDAAKHSLVRQPGTEAVAMPELDGAAPHDRFTITWVGEWVRYARQVADELDEPLARVGADARTPWWR